MAERTEKDKQYDFYRDVVDKIFNDTSAVRENMTRNYKHWAGEIWADMPNKSRPDESKAIINYCFSTVENIAPMLTDNRPIISVAPKQEFLVPLGESYRLALRYFWQIAEMDILTLKAWLSALIMKKGIFKVYFDPALRIDGDIRVEVEDPRHFFSAPGYTDPWYAPYQGVRCRRPISVVKKLIEKNGWDMQAVEPDDPGEKEAWDSRDIKFGDAESAELSTFSTMIYEIWEGPGEGNIIREQQGAKKVEEGDSEKAHMIYLTKDKFLGSIPLEDYHKKPIWISLDDYVDPFNSLGICDVDMVRTLNQELNLQFQKLAGFTNRYHNPNWYYNTNVTMEDPEVLKKEFLKGGNLFAVDMTEQGAGAPFGVIAAPNMIPDIHRMIGMIIKLMEEMSGVTEIAKGIAATKEQSASEASILAESSYTRTRQRVRQYESTIGRLDWLVIMLMQQYYQPDRSYNFKNEEGQLTYGRIGNSRAHAESVMQMPDESIRRLIMGSGQSQNIMNLEERDAHYEEFIKAFGEKDKVFFDFDVIVETNSSLPLDMQSLANLMLRLGQMKFADRRGVLETLKIPGGREMADRMDKREQAMMAARRGGQQPRAASPQQLTGPQGVAR